MFSYSPTVNDRNGEILAAGQIGAAQTNAQMMQGIGENIGQALQTIGGTVGGVMQQNAIGDSAFEALRAIGEMYPGMKKTFGALEGMDPRTRRLASLSIIDNLGAISQLGIAGMNQQIRAAQPYVDAVIGGYKDKAAGNVPHGGSGVPQSPAGMAPVEPDLPVGDENLPAVGGPAAAPAASIPGGQSSIDAINRDRQRRGLPPIK